MVNSSTYYATGVTATGTGWVAGTPANATGANNSVFAQFTTNVNGAVGYLQLSGYDTSNVNGGVTPHSVISVMLQPYTYVQQTNRWSSITCQLYTSAGVAIGSPQTLTISNTSANWEFASFTGITWEQVQAGFQARVTATKNGTQSNTFYVDAVGLVVAYEPADPPTVNAGADAAVDVNTAFTRTATESGIAATSRAWTIEAGPTGVGSTIGTAAALSWTPTVTGTYTLRYSATNQYGTGTDDVIVTVNATPPPTVNAGADITSFITNTVTRTATETGTGITARSWTINSGPADVGSTLSTTTALSWNPTAAGTYVLRYSATNANGTGIDDVTVTVTNVRTNLIPNPSSETTAYATNAPTGGGTITQSTGWSNSGTYSTLVTQGTAYTYAGLPSPGVTPLGVTRYWGAWVMASANCTVAYARRTASFTVTTYTLTANVPQWITTSWVGDGTTAARFDIGFEQSYATAGTLLYIDSVLVEDRATAPVAADYFDGDTAATATNTHAWTGTPHASTSTLTYSPAPADAYKQAVMADSPVGYWRLDETSGTVAANEVSGGNTGTYMNGALPNQTPLIGTGRSVGLDGTNDYVDVVAYTAIQPTTAISVEAWINADTLPASGWVSVATRSDAYTIQFLADQIEFSVKNSATATFRARAASGVIVPGQTYHVVGTYDGSNIRLYVNGVQRAITAHTEAINTGTQALRIGAWDGTPIELFDGRIDEVAVYGSALSESRIQAHYAAGGGIEVKTATGSLPASVGLTGTAESVFTLPYTETFTAANGSSWPAVWTKFGSGTVDIQSNAGRIVPPTGTFAGTRSELTGMGSIGDTEISGTVIGAVAGVEQYPIIFINGSGSDTAFYTPGTSYFLALEYNATAASSRVAIYTRSGGAETVRSTLTKTLVGTTRYGFRFQRVGQVLRGRSWDASGAEPSSWDVTYTIVGTPNTGLAGVGVENGAATTARQFTYDDLTVSAAADIRTVTGSTPVTAGLVGDAVGVGVLTGSTPVSAGLTGDVVGVGVLAGSTPVTVGLTGSSVGVGVLTGSTPVSVGLTGAAEKVASTYDTTQFMPFFM